MKKVKTVDTRKKVLSVHPVPYEWEVSSIQWFIDNCDENNYRRTSKDNQERDEDMDMDIS